MELDKTLDKFGFTNVLKNEIFIKLRKLFIKSEIEENYILKMGGIVNIDKMIKRMGEIIIRHDILLK